MSKYATLKEGYIESLGQYFTWYCKEENLWILEVSNNEYVFDLEYDRDVFIEAVSKAIILEK